MGKSEASEKQVLDPRWWISLATAAVILLLLFKAKGGLLGLILGVAAVAVFLYWVIELSHLSKGSRWGVEAELYYDVFDEGDILKVIATVPGPDEQLDLVLGKGLLEIWRNDKRIGEVKIPGRVVIDSKSYNNGVLQVILEKQGKQPS